VKRATLVLIALTLAACGGGQSAKPLPKRPPPALAARCGDAYAHLRARLVWFRS